MKAKYEFRYGNGMLIRVYKVERTYGAECEGVVFFSIGSGPIHHRYLYRSQGDRFYFTHKDARIFIDELTAPVKKRKKLV